MESHAVSARLGATRERMRALLVPDESERDAAFPRSALMRVVFNTGARRLTMSLFSVFLMLRRRSLPGASLLPQLARSLGGLVGSRRR